LDSATCQFVDSLHEAQQQVSIFTANEPIELGLAVELGVDGIISVFRIGFQTDMMRQGPSQKQSGTTNGARPQAAYSSQCSSHRALSVRSVSYRSKSDAFVIDT